ncbi:MAG: DUF5110 domain-containing protein, partial [Bacteroidota bacterium]
GQPVLRNLFFYDQKDENCRKHGDQFFFGEDLLVSPVIKKGAKSTQVYLPKGQWINYFSKKTYTGARKIRISHTLGSFPLFVRAGAIIPTVSPVQHTAELAKAKDLLVQVYLGVKNGVGSFYWDEGEGYNYEKEEYCSCQFTYRQGRNKLVITKEQSGQFTPSFKKIKLQLIGLQTGANGALVDGKKTALIEEEYGFSVWIPFGFKEVEIG